VLLEIDFILPIHAPSSTPSTIMMRLPDTDVSTSHGGYPETAAADPSKDKQKVCIKLVSYRTY
jgi:hypothetical protein